MPVSTANNTTQGNLSRLCCSARAGNDLRGRVRRTCPHVEAICGKPSQNGASSEGRVKRLSAPKASCPPTKSLLENWASRKPDVDSFVAAASFQLQQDSTGFNKRPASH